MWILPKSYALDKVTVSSPYYKYHLPCVRNIERIQQREANIFRASFEE